MKKTNRAPLRRRRIRLWRKLLAPTASLARGHKEREDTKNTEDHGEELYCGVAKEMLNSPEGMPSA